MRYYEVIDKVLTENGWTLCCESPLELQHEDSGSVATGLAAEIVIEHYMIEDSGIKVILEVD